jgi:RNA polymerase sigma-70 factor (ECF subfamily)
VARSFTSTSASLLAQLRQEVASQAAWDEFVRRYGPLIRTWCRQWRLQEADVHDVTQTVLAKLADKMRTFADDPTLSFRGYLKTLARYAWCDFLEAYKRPGAGTGDSEVLLTLESLEAGEDLVQRLNEQFDQELLAEAAALASRDR